ncbi:MAG: TonB-dependent receptor [Bacteroidota bacterium]
MSRSLGLAVALAALASGPAAAQADGGGLVFRGAPASEALATVAERAGVDVVFSTALVGIRPVWCGGSGWDTEDLLRCVTEAVGLDYVRRSTGTYVVVRPTVEPAAMGGVAGRVVDGETGAPLPLAHVRLGRATTITDASGRFTLADIPAGPHVLLTSYVGYQAQAARLQVSPGGMSQRTVGLRPVVASVGTVVVSGIEGRSASEDLGTDSGFEVLGERVQRAPIREAAGAPPLSTAPAQTSAVIGPATQALLGISGRSFRDALSIQGGEAGDHALTIDGARIYEPLQIGPILGSLAPLAVSRVTVRKAGFGARHGSHLAGRIEAEHAVSTSRAPLSIAAEGDAFAASARLEGRRQLGTWGRDPVEAVAFVAARRSLWDVAPPAALSRSLREWNDVDPVLASALHNNSVPPRPGYDAHRHGSDVSFSDLHAAARVQAGPLRSLRASVYRGDAQIGTELFAVGAPHADASGPDPAAALAARDATRWSTLAASARADAIVSARWRLFSGLRLSDHGLRQRYDAIDGVGAGLDGTEAVSITEGRLLSALDAQPSKSNGNDLTTVSLDAGAAVALGLGQELTVGVEATSASGRFHLLSEGFGATAFRDLDADVTRLRLATFVDGRHRLGSRWTVEPGLRLTALTSGDVLAEPRLALRYDAMPGDRLGPISLRGVAARVAAGVYRQFETRVELATFGPSALVPAVALWLPTDGTVDPPTALHAAGDILWQPSPRWTARVEAYAKALPRVYALDYQRLLGEGPVLSRQADFLLPEEGRAAGIGLRLERLAPRWAASGGVSIARTDRRSESRFNGRWVPAPWAEPVRATLGFDVLAFGSRGGSGLLLRTRALGIWGRSWALRRAYYDVIGARQASVGSFDLGRPEGDRLTPLIMLDLGAAYTLSLGSSRQLEVAVDVANALDRDNVLDWSLRPAGDSVGAVTRTLPGIQPSARVRLTF